MYYKNIFLRVLFLVCSVGLMIPLIGTLGPGIPAAHGSDDSPVLVLEAENGKLQGKASASGGKVGNIGKNGGSVEGKVAFGSLELPYDGEYLLNVYYLSGSDDRYFDIKTDFGEYRLDCPNTGGFDKVGSVKVKAELKSGGSLIFGSGWYGPDLDRVEIFRSEQSGIPQSEYTDPVYYTWRDQMKIDTANGVYTVIIDGREALVNARAEAVIEDEVISSDGFEIHECSEDSERGILTVTHRSHPVFSGTMTQIFYKKNDDHIVTEVVIGSDHGIIRTNRITPAAVNRGGTLIKNGVFLKIPFDNDMWVEPEFITVNNAGRSVTGYEAAALFDAETSEGLIVGSLSHDTWKSGVEISSSLGEPTSFRIYAGVADAMTRDNSPHGYVSGSEVRSPLVFIGLYDDWRKGMTAYGRANAEITPPKESVKDVPFGFNSWGTLQSGVKYSQMISVSDYIKGNFQDVWSGDGSAVYVNIDSFWDFITINDPGCGMDLDQALMSFVRHCKKNGQKAGIYFTPFACWHGDEAALKSSRIEGTSYTYYDAAMKKSDGSGLYGKLDGGYALDPTHPGTIARFEQQLKYFIKLGFEYIKLDFMTHGALEGEHFDKSVATGLQAYNQGMARILEICGDKMFIDLSIAPLFPYQYADGRRISCDAFSSVDNTMHVLSCLTGCFWEKEIYNYPDPDHLVVTGESEGAARCRVTAGAICGTSFLVGDDLSSIREGSANERRILKMFGNSEIVSVAKLGKAFIPFEVTAGKRCADAYWCEADGALYFALFNFDTKKKNLTFDLSKTIDILPSDTVTELWSGAESRLDGTILNVTVNGQDASLFRIGTPQGAQENGDPGAVDDIPGGSAKEKLSGAKIPLIAGGALIGIFAAFVTAALVAAKRKRGKEKF